jgi:hypothetical protein
MLTDALGEKVKKNNFKQALQRYGEKQNLEKQFTNEYYLNHILNVLSDVVTWKDLMKIKTIKSSNTYHFSSLRERIRP